ncbi:hypothetical protein HZS_601 [Henneguya salminicola]|nr:hypothetical protein HZS_601 [Henneguya salminicola]
MHFVNGLFLVLLVLPAICGIGMLYFGYGIVTIFGNANTMRDHLIYVFAFIPSMSVLFPLVLGWAAFFSKRKVLIKFYQNEICVTTMLLIGVVGLLKALRDGVIRDEHIIHIFQFNKMHDSEESKLYFDSFQARFGCCGLRGPLDYVSAKLEVPESCKKSAKGPRYSEVDANNIYSTGCIKAFDKLIGVHFIILIVLMGVTATNNVMFMNLIIVYYDLLLYLETEKQN